MAALTVVFDLDGTLVDTAPDLIETLNVVFAREGLPPVAYAAARDMIGGGARKMIEGGLKLEGRALSRRRRSIGCSPISSPITRTTSPTARGRFPASTPRSTGSPRAAAASRSAPTSSKACRGFCSMRSASPARFAAICGQDTFGIQKPDPEILRRTIQAAGGEVGHAVMVGDSGTDIATARAAGIPVVAVDFGYSETPIEELAPGPPDQPFRRARRSRSGARAAAP